MSVSLLLLSAALTLQAADKPFVSEAGGFQIDMPGKPTEQHLKIPSAVGEIEVHLFVLDQGKVALFAAYNDYPEIAVKNVNPVLEGAVSGSVGNVKGKLISKKDITLGGIPGKAYDYSVPRPGQPDLMGRSRIFLDGRRLYQTIVIGEEEQVKAKSTETYLDSFKLTKPAGKS